MRGFRFRLQPVLGLRQHELDARRRVLDRARVQEAAARRAVAVARNVAADADRELGRRLKEGLGADEVRALREGVARLYAEVTRAELRQASLREKVGQLRREALAAWARLRSLELLRGRALEAHREILERREQALQDELAGQRAYRRSS